MYLYLVEPRTALSWAWVTLVMTYAALFLGSLLAETAATPPMGNCFWNRSDNRLCSARTCAAGVMRVESGAVLRATPILVTDLTAIASNGSTVAFSSASCSSILASLMPACRSSLSLSLICDCRY
jgi:hypothetical protein